METEGTLILDRLHVNDFDVAKSLSTLKGTLFLPSISIPDSPFEGSTLFTKPNIHVGMPHFGKSLSAEEAAVLVLIHSVGSFEQRAGGALEASRQLLKKRRSNLQITEEIF